MTPLDLSRTAPRKPRATLGAITFLPRSIDKVRAAMPGGNLGPYTIEGFTLMMLETLAIPLADFTAAVETAASDADIEAFVLARTSHEQRAAWESFIGERRPRGGNRVEALQVYPWLGERPDLVFALDILAEDDVRFFASAQTPKGS